ncbi:MAG: tripartite tricarboxylate transporter TctB family protein [Rubrivivax sp.]|nr:tripartite tricarboxylate transporter TctB family protein [Rubrivivax sp.]
MIRHPEKIFTWFLLMMFTLLFAVTWQYAPRARLVPLVLLVPAWILTAIQLWQTYHKVEVKKDKDKGEEDYELNAPFGQEMKVLGLFILLAAMIGFFGFLIATPLFLFIFVRGWAKEGWWLSLSLSGFTTIAMYLLVEVEFRIILYRGWLFSF